MYLQPMRVNTTMRRARRGNCATKEDGARLRSVDARDRYFLRRRTIDDLAQSRAEDVERARAAVELRC